MSNCQIIRLPNGVALAEYGDRNGLPVIFCHGWPSSQTMALLTDRAARELGVWILSPDRPGISDSVFQAERKLEHWPAVVESIAQHFRIDSFRMLGISGGAPYCYAGAWAMPERVRAIAVVSGVPPIFELSDYEGLLPLYRWMLALYRHQRNFLRLCFHVARPFAAMPSSIRAARQFVRFLQPCDAESLLEAEAFEACFESQRRAWRGSARGVIADAEIYAQPWGFTLEQIQVPVRLWHGKKDRTFSYRLAEEIGRRLPNCHARIVDNAGHYSLPIRNMREILADLMHTGERP